MSTPPAAIEKLARCLIALESARDPSPPQGLEGAERVCEKFKESLARMGGVAGFRSLLSRAIALGKRNFPGLKAVQVLEDGTLDGLGSVDRDSQSAIVSHLIDLLKTLIGKPLTLQLVRESWPQAGKDAMDGGVEEQQ